jgi:hypothetical protein
VAVADDAVDPLDPGRRELSGASIDRIASWSGEQEVRFRMDRARLEIGKRADDNA